MLRRTIAGVCTAGAVMTGAFAAEAAKPKLPPYPEALRCAGLAEAAADPKDQSKDGRQRFDQAMFWGMAASEAARKAKVSGAQFTDDQTKARSEAAAQLKAGDEAASTQLRDCAKRVPKLER